NTTEIDGVTFSDIGLSAPATGMKTWIDFLVTLSPSATNPEGMPHNFVITATVNNGTGAVPAVGASIAFTWSGSDPSTPTSPCTTNASGTCTVTVMSTTPAAGTLTVMSLTDSAGHVVDLTTAGAHGQAEGQVVPLSATKTWIAGEVIVPPPPTVTEP